MDNVDKKKVWLIIALPILAAILLILAACGAKTTPTPVVKTVTVGCVGPFSGSAAAWGEGLKRGLTQFADEVNARGGIEVSDALYTIDIECFNGEFTSQGGVAAGNRLILEKGVQWVVGPITSPECLGWQQVAEPLKAISIIPVGCWGNGIISPEHPGTFRLGLSFREQGPVHAAWVQQNLPQVQTVAYVAPDNATGRDSTAQMRTAFEAAGLQTVDAQFYRPDAVDFYPILTRMLRLKPDLIYAIVMPDADQGLLWKQAWELDYQGAKMGSLVNLPEGLKASDGPQPWEGVYVLGGVPYCNPGASLPSELALCQTLKEKYGEEPSIYAFTGYAAMEIISKIWQAVGSVDDLQAAIDWWEANPNIETISGLQRLGGMSRYSIQRVTFGDIGAVVIQNGEVVPFFRGPAAYEP